MYLSNQFFKFTFSVIKKIKDVLLVFVKYTFL